MSHNSTPSWPSLYNPVIEFFPIEHRDAVQPNGRYLYNAGGMSPKFRLPDHHLTNSTQTSTNSPSTGPLYSTFPRSYYAARMRSSTSPSPPPTLNVRLSAHGRRFPSHRHRTLIFLFRRRFRSGHTRIRLRTQRHLSVQSSRARLVSTRPAHSALTRRIATSCRRAPGHGRTSGGRGLHLRCSCCFPLRFSLWAARCLGRRLLGTFSRASIVEAISICRREFGPGLLNELTVLTERQLDTFVGSAAANPRGHLRVSL